MFSALSTLLYDWTNGVIMISVFGLVCVILIGVLVNFMTGGKGKKKTNSN